MVDLSAGKEGLHPPCLGGGGMVTLFWGGEESMITLSRRALSFQPDPSTRLSCFVLPQMGGIVTLSEGGNQ